MNKYFNLAVTMTGFCSFGLATVPISANTASIDNKNISKIKLLKTPRSFSMYGEQQITGYKIKTYKQPGFTAATSYSILNKEPETKAISTIALGLIKEFEGFEDRAYLDTDGTPVIGYGLSKINGKSVNMGDRISPAKADAALQAELKEIQKQIDVTVNRELTESQISALASLSFNVGFGAIKTSTLVRKINAGDYTGAADEFLRWDKANVRGQLVRLPGLTRRRQAERQLFLR